ncbi:hypothetical protein DB32_002732 [Sandaracinus amylolyticus]|uniref:Uncharacterized protein n=1 Tax=Sandaracinus amylolyticus TaxID=927083 RepID=A0A0F6W2H7_9BACT|nr:hypothetical protein DB32_002732 [Sandaracinus amylolyticus]
MRRHDAIERQRRVGDRAVREGGDARVDRYGRVDPGGVRQSDGTRAVAAHGERRGGHERDKKQASRHSSSYAGRTQTSPSRLGGRALRDGTSGERRKRARGR